MRQPERQFVRVAALHAAIQVAELRGKARVEFDHRNPVAGFVVDEFHVEGAVGEAGRGQKPVGDVQCATTRHRIQTRRRVEAHEGLCARIHDRVDKPEFTHDTVPDIAIEVVLLPVDGFFKHHAVCRARACQALFRHPFERFDKVAYHPKLPGAKAGVGVQISARSHCPRQNRKSRLDRLDERRIGQSVGGRRPVFSLQRRISDVRIRTNA